MKTTEIESYLRPIIENLNVELVEVQFTQAAEPSLTVFIDRAGGVDINTCEKVHTAIDEPLDILDPTFGAPYRLNVSSVGLDWQFKTKRDFERNIGMEVEFKLFAASGGKKEFEGVLLGYDGENITVDVGGAEQKFQVVKIAKITKLIKI